MRPFTAACPVCGAQQSLTLYQISAADGDWAHCGNCGFAGDIVTLAATCWKLGIEEGVARLARENLLKATIKTTLRAYQNAEKKQKAATTAIAAAQAAWRDADDAATTALRQQLGAPAVYTHSAAEASFGAADASLLRSILAVTRKDPRLPPKGGATALLPAYDLPGRVCGVLLLPSDDSSATYCPLTLQPAGSPLVLCEAWFSSPAPPLYAITVFLCPVVAAKLQLQQAVDKKSSLPLAAAVSAGNTSFQFLRENPLFWADDISDGLVAAARGDGYVVSKKLPLQVVRRRMAQLPASHWVSRGRIAATDWRLVLERELLRLPGGEASRLTDRLQLTAEGEEDFLAGCRETSRRRLLPLFCRRRRRHGVTIAGRQVLETRTGWVLAESRELVSDVRVRLSEVLVSETRSAYRGVAFFRGKAYRFTAPAGEFDKDAFGWLLRFLRDARQAGLPAFSDDWRLRGAELCRRFSRYVKITRVSAVAGWDGESGLLRFPHFSLSSAGAVSTPGVLLPEETGFQLPEPGAMTGERVLALSSRRTQCEIVWAAAVFVSCNLVAAMQRRRRYSLLADRGITADRAWPALSQLGCTENLCGWPQLVPGRRQQYSDTLENVVLEGDSVRQLLLWPQQHWLVIRNEHETPSLCALIQEASQHIVPNYMQYLLRTGTPVVPSQSTKSPPLDLVARSMKDWFRAVGGDCIAVSRGAKLLQPLYGLAGPALLAAACQQLESEGYLKPRTDADNLRWVSRRQLYIAGKKATGDCCDMPAISELLRKAGLPETAVAGEYGWRLPV